MSSPGQGSSWRFLPGPCVRFPLCFQAPHVCHPPPPGILHSPSPAPQPQLQSVTPLGCCWTCAEHRAGGLTAMPSPDSSGSSVSPT